MSGEGRMQWRDGGSEESDMTLGWLQKRKVLSTLGSLWPTSLGLTFKASEVSGERVMAQ